MKSYVVRDVKGEILRTGVCSEGDISLQASPGQTVEVSVAPVCDSTHYHNGTAYEDRPSFDLQPTSLTTVVDQAITIANIPVGTLVSQDGNAVTVDDGSLDFESDVTGTFTLTFENFPYKPATIEVTVNDAT